MNPKQDKTAGVPAVKLLNLGCGSRRLDGFENLDASTGWRFEDGLPNIADATVQGITVSHSLMYVSAADLPGVLAEIARVLAPGGVLRLTEDDTENPESERFGGWHDAVTLTGPKMMGAALRKAGLRVLKQDATTTAFRDGSLLQAWHGAEPKVFFLEGRKP